MNKELQLEAPFLYAKKLESIKTQSTNNTK